MFNHIFSETVYDRNGIISMGEFSWKCKLREMLAIFRINYYVHLNNGVSMAHDDVVGDEREMGTLSFMWCAKSVITLHEMLTYNLEWNLHVFTWLLHNFANLLVNVFTIAPQKDIWLSQLEILFWFILSFFPAAIIVIYLEISGTTTACSWRMANNKMHENWRQSPEIRAEKCNEAKKRSFWQTMCSFLFIPISRIFPHMHTHIHDITCAYHSSIFNSMVLCITAWC